MNKARKILRRKGHINTSTADVEILSELLRAELQRFVEYHPCGRFSRNLRSMLLDFLMCDGALESVYLKELLIDFEGLFDLLDAIDHEQRNDIRRGG